MDINENDIKNFLAVAAAAAAFYQSLRAKHAAKKAVATAEELRDMCSYPDCGHVCGSEEAKNRTAAPLPLKPKRAA